MLKLKFVNIIYIILYAIPNTILSFGTLYIINNAISGNKEFIKGYMWIVFVAVVVYTYLLNIIFQKKLNQYTYNILYENEKNVFKKILQTPLIVLEKFGSQRFYTAIEDIRVFGSFSGVVTHTVNSLLMLVLCLAYMFAISLYSALIVLGLIILIAAIFFVVINSMSQKLAVLRKFNEHYYNYVNDVIKGFKDLKVDRNKRNNLMNRHLTPNRDDAKDLDYKINFVFLSINLISQYGLYLVIGAILFLLPALNLLTREEVGSYVVILLFITGPINNLINMQNVYAQYMVSNDRIKKFLFDFQIAKEESTVPTEVYTGEFDSVELNNIGFRYNNSDADTIFELGPLNLKIDKGEVIFVIGGNGSGKSTFINILTGLYEPSSGELLLNNEDITADNTVIQNLIAAVFTDNHIFSHNYDDYLLENNDKYRKLLETMELDKVIVDDKEESARRSFSKGQGKRMSLIFALLENKPILVLDEWAADQDPHFRKYFYEKLVPKLKEEGKTIIAVTHDDAYFKYADRIIKFDYGQIVKDFEVKEEVLHTESLWHRD
ncbi:putative ATP-binding cassette transporter [Flavobacterium araucananum]|jgi:putative ATP-binding cassette transporter|uniref:Cyclic peptide transporter n=1 Tax=Flavobacterium araucananum TaxID=946678 RepID=A0A227PH43_9FLAO|nr:cyclic peptide export ABC transporter [Flavobacterium araucananum]OXG09132.1 cyclic peptide transporter [Flavobacterium araucananum]PWJ99672.1 putative ATP-binding cassette transporter [Flavobacterium araucananum]